MASPEPSRGEDESQARPGEGSRSIPAWLARGDLTFAVIASLFAAQAVIRFASHLSGEVAWYLYASGRLIDGAGLYSDVVEVSSPLGLWLTIPVVALARAVALNPIIVLKTILLLLCAVSILLSASLLSLAKDLPAAIRNLILIAIAVLLLVLPGEDFGQREHVAILLVTPWLLLQWHRLSGRDVPLTLAVIIGVLAGPGFLIKPHFILAFLAVVLVVTVISRDWRNAVRAENLLVVLFAAAYAVAAQHLLTGRYDMSILGTRAFVPFYGEPFEALVRQLLLPVLLAFAAVLSSGRGDERLHFLQTLLVVAGVTFVFVGVVQVGLAYQFLPALFCLTLAVCVGITGLAIGKSSGFLGAVAVAVSGAALLLVVAFGLSRQFTFYRGEVFAVAIEREAPEARKILVASNSVEDAFPLVVEKDLVWASRFPRQWLLRYVAAVIGGVGTPDDYLLRYTLDAVVGDLVAFTPEIVFIERAEAAEPRDAFDHLGFWRRDHRFETFWLDYEERPPLEGFSVYVRKAG